MQLLAISGSLRRASTNTTLLHAAAALAPNGVTVSLYTGLGDLPHFNADLEPALPAAVADLRTRVGQAHGLLISSPEYAHGVPGVVKNALDWLVGGAEFVGKPIALLSASPRATHAQAQLADTIATMAGRLVPEACATIPLLGTKLDARAVIADPTLAAALHAALAAFAHAIAHHGDGTTGPAQLL